MYYGIQCRLHTDPINLNTAMELFLYLSHTNMQGRIIDTHLHEAAVTVLTEHDFGKLQHPYREHAESNTSNYIIAGMMPELRIVGRAHASL